MCKHDKFHATQTNHFSPSKPKMLPIPHAHIFWVIKIKRHLVQHNIYKDFLHYNRRDHKYMLDYYTLDYYNLLLPFVSPSTPNLVVYILHNDNTYIPQFAPITFLANSVLHEDKEHRNEIHAHNFCSRLYPTHQPSFFLILIFSALNNQVKKSFGNLFCISIPLSWNN